MARKARIQESIRRYLEGLERKKRIKKRKTGNLFDLVSYEPQKKRAIIKHCERRKG
jgi:hypothetical protein